MGNDEHISALSCLLYKIAGDLENLGYPEYAAWIESEINKLEEDDDDG